MQTISVQQITNALDIAFFDEATCRQWLLETIHPAGPSCPHCGHNLQPSRTAAFYRGRRIVCKHCARWFDARTETILDNSRLNYRSLVLLMVLLSANVERKEIASRVGLSVETIREWQKRLGA